MAKKRQLTPAEIAAQAGTDRTGFADDASNAADRATAKAEEARQSAIRAQKAKTRSDAGSFIAATGSHLTAIDDDIAAPPPRRMTVSSIIATSTADTGSRASTLGCHHATVDNNGATIFIMFVAANASSMYSASNVDGAAVDGDDAYFKSTDTRLILIAAVDGQCTRSVDGQAIAFAHLDAFLGHECNRIIQYKCLRSL